MLLPAQELGGPHLSPTYQCLPVHSMLSPAIKIEIQSYPNVSAFNRQQKQSGKVFGNASVPNICELHWRGLVTDCSPKYSDLVGSMELVFDLVCIWSTNPPGYTYRPDREVHSR
jgi:hypothetical protein